MEMKVRIWVHHVGNYETTPHRVAAAPATPGGVDLRVRHCEFLGSGEWGSRRETYPLFSSPPLPLSVDDGGTRALMLKLSGSVGKSISGGGGLLRLLPPFSFVSAPEAPSRRLFLRRWANEREGSSRGSDGLPVRLGRTRFILRAETLPSAFCEFSPSLSSLTLIPAPAELLWFPSSRFLVKSGFPRGWNECRPAPRLDPSPSRSRIISRTLRAEEDRACRPLRLLLIRPSPRLPCDGKKPNVVLVGGAEGGVVKNDLGGRRCVVEEDLDSGLDPLFLMSNGASVALLLGEPVGPTGWDRRRREEMETMLISASLSSPNSIKLAPCCCCCCCRLLELMVLPDRRPTDEYGELPLRFDSESIEAPGNGGIPTLRPLATQVSVRPPAREVPTLIHLYRPS